MVDARSYIDVLMFVADAPRRYEPGSVIFSEGDAAAEMYIVRAGSVELRKGGQLIETLEAGAIVGEMALIDPAPRSATAVAGPGCELVSLDEQHFQELVRRVPGFALELARTVVKRFRQELARS
jgi:CRP-like cAMP-binding protein